MKMSYKQIFTEEMLKDAKCIKIHLNQMIDRIKERNPRYFSTTKCKFIMSSYTYKE